MEDLAKHINTYQVGHPWYYVLGGSVQTPKEILEQVKESGYQGYMVNDILKAANRPEPQRSKILRHIKEQVLISFRQDLSRYRRFAWELHQHRKQYGSILKQPVCADIHTNISLKYGHLYNDLAHLKCLDELLSCQGDLFG